MSDKTGLAELGAAVDVLLVGEEAVLAQPVLAQHLAEGSTVEPARCPVLEVGISGHHPGDLGRREGQTVILGPFVERCVAHHAVEDLPVEPEGARLLGRDRRAGLLRDLLHLPVVDALELVGRDRGRANGGDVGRVEAAEHILDAPQPEAGDEQQHEAGEDPAGDPPREGGSDGGEHRARGLDGSRAAYHSGAGLS